VLVQRAVAGAQAGIAGALAHLSLHVLLVAGYLGDERVLVISAGSVDELLPIDSWHRCHCFTSTNAMHDHTL
jgi:hypothetical protein